MTSSPNITCNSCKKPFPFTEATTTKIGLICPKCKIIYNKENKMTERMTFEEYKKNVMVTAPKNDDVNWHLLHGIMGISTEAGELMDVMKKNLAYGKTIDIVNIKEEIADAMWYIAYLCVTQNFDLEEMMATNIAKLKVRFGDKFTQAAALNRDLDAERKVLER